MICTGVIPCLSSGLAKNNKIMSMFVLFSQLFGHLKVCFFLENGGGGVQNLTPKQSNRIFLVNFSKLQQK